MYDFVGDCYAWGCWIRPPAAMITTAAALASTQSAISMEGHAQQSVKDSDEPSAEGTQEVVNGVDLESKEPDAVMQEGPDNEGKDKEHDDELAETNVVVGEKIHGDDDGAGYHEEGVEGDGADEQHDVEMPALVKERIKQKEFEVSVVGLDKDADEEDLKKVFSEVGEVLEIRLTRNPQTQKNKGFAFVRFTTLEQAKKAVVELKNPQEAAFCSVVLWV